eukprot:CAMPEP_0174265012 /NCGR_PEP_ID=MMETSP0439-20130205/24825_1 /TAXON_ID=0 /ORGANISM="Stereomyxa ramosa, Strain Chinc5" /LENGTH=227 /DNA_ID=CAMNT_0015351207 /DNA_START=579 /DNA_END=1263 /DNA_ORIENTATION=-
MDNNPLSQMGAMSEDAPAATRIMTTLIHHYLDIDFSLLDTTNDTEEVQKFEFSSELGQFVKSRPAVPTRTTRRKLGQVSEATSFSLYLLRHFEKVLFRSVENDKYIENRNGKLYCGFESSNFGTVTGHGTTREMFEPVYTPPDDPDYPYLGHFSFVNCHGHECIEANENGELVLSSVPHSDGHFFEVELLENDLIAIKNVKFNQYISFDSKLRLCLSDNDEKFFNSL